VGPTVTGGLVFWPWNAAGDVLRLFRELTVSAPDELMLVANVLGAPDGSGTKAAAIGACHCGALRDGEAAVRPIKAFGTPVMDTVGPMTYCEINAMLDAGYPKGARNYWKSQFLPELTDEAIHTMVECYEKCPSPMSEIYREHLHGAAARVGVGETAFPLRSPGYNFLVLSQWMDPADDEQCIAWARETYAAMQPFVGVGRYVNYLDDDEPGDAVAAAYDLNYRRLREIKTKYDPANFFHRNQNIRPLS
jgi:FAD/FMN-containing dehydrogenase